MIGISLRLVHRRRGFRKKKAGLVEEHVNVVVSCIYLRPLPPWRAGAFTEIEIGLDRETARERAQSVHDG